MACLMIARYLFKKNFIRKETKGKETPAQYSTGIRAMGCKQDQHAAMGIWVCTYVEIQIYYLDQIRLDKIYDIRLVVLY